MAFTAIKKLIGMAESGLQTDRRGRSLGRQEGSPLATTRTMRDELFELSCVCAITDRPYVLQYRSRAGKLKFLRAIKGEAANATGRGNAREIGLGVSVAFDAFESLSFPCPWCGSKRIIECLVCDALVCGGRMRNGIFRCRTSCGNYGECAVMESITGRRSERSAVCAPGGPSKNALASRSSGTALVKR